MEFKIGKRQEARGKRNPPLTPPRRGRQEARGKRQEEPTPNPSQEGKARGKRQEARGKRQKGKNLMYIRCESWRI
ncbi:hypothetical protein BJP34_02865 [Moorena producens PAL-8-15-08-1]|uniref:Uncharacterized protein n=1 Tax=Moorena producens PAL-8-15-08-1 TaxID=1458985 RepID=A0A1D8TLN8_9CYAN|nr:hypothetical protein BJP34_02865 [Moorena producens PAL-8-15-08-1]